MANRGNYFIKEIIVLDMITPLITKFKPILQLNP